MNGARGFLTFKEKLRDKAAKVMREAVLSCGTEIILDTPVDSGLLRGNWQASLHTPPAGVKPLKDPSGSATIAALSRAVANLQPGDALFLANNLPYAEAVEYGQHSRQAPAGMMRVNTAHWAWTVQDAARKAAS